MKAIIVITATLFILYILLIIFTKRQLQRIKERVKISNVTGADLLKYKEKLYYREILKSYSPAELSYIDNFEIDGKREVIATLLSLKLKGAIDILNDKIEIKNDKSKDLLLTEEFVLRNIKNGKVYLKYDSFKNKILEEVNKDGLVDEHPLLAEAKIACEKIILFIIVCVFYIFGFLCLKILNKDVDEIFSIFSFALVLILVVYYRESKVILSKRMPKYEAFVKRMAKCEFLKRSQKGEDINIRIEGLKKYIKDYSLLDEKNKDALDVWEEYLIYSVLFNGNLKVIYDMSNLVNIVRSN